MLWIKAFHLISIVAWFSGLFYLPRLYVYHADCHDEIGNIRFKIMERKLYFYIMTPAAIITMALGLWLLSFNPNGYMHMVWFHIKITLIVLLVLFHLYLGKLLLIFKRDQNKKTAKFYRFINEIPTIFLLSIVILAVVKPFGFIHF